jgi:hypothetical protein
LDSFFKIAEAAQICLLFFPADAGLPDFFGAMRENIPNNHKIYQMAIIDQHLPLQDPPKFTKIGILGMKIYHLAALRGSS